MVAPVIEVFDAATKEMRPAQWAIVAPMHGLISIHPESRFENDPIYPLRVDEFASRNRSPAYRSLGKMNRNAAQPVMVHLDHLVHRRLF